MMIDMTATATMIKSLRRDHGLTQEDLAARAGCGNVPERIGARVAERRRVFGTPNAE